ncbi:FLYWCH family member 2 isoform X4 [Symphalangus syndactylus]|uniref:FLYWCH family member 2 isoform X4 n=1 Tax=Symphalangus syndactylus TaxID=9590 RepID=UPI0024412063|nr:FLYWCH family member 2 isoform X3 [Symphalangus syndactylus]
MQEAASFLESGSAAVAEPTRREALEDPGWTGTWVQGTWHLFLSGPPIHTVECGRCGEIGRQRDVRRSQSACEARSRGALSDRGIHDISTSLSPPSQGSASTSSDARTEPLDSTFLAWE